MLPAQEFISVRKIKILGLCLHTMEQLVPVMPTPKRGGGREWLGRLGRVMVEARGTSIR